MKIFRNLLLILATIFIFELSFTNDAKDGKTGAEADIKSVKHSRCMKLLFIKCICVQVYQLSLLI